MILSDKLKIAGLFKDMRLLKITEEEIKSYDKDGRLFLNINTPDDLKNKKKKFSFYKFL